VKKAEVDSGKRAGVPTEVADKMKALERVTCLTCPPGFHQQRLEPSGFVAHERGLSNGLRSGARRA